MTKPSGVKDASGNLTSMDSVNGVHTCQVVDGMLSDKDWLEVELSSPQTVNHLVIVAEAQQGSSKDERHAVKVSPGWLPGKKPEQPTTGQYCHLSSNIVV